MMMTMDHAAMGLFPAKNPARPGPDPGGGGGPIIHRSHQQQHPAGPSGVGVDNHTNLVGGQVNLMDRAATSVPYKPTGRIAQLSLSQLPDDLISLFLTIGHHIFIFFFFNSSGPLLSLFSFFFSTISFLSRHHGDGWWATTVD